MGGWSGSNGNAKEFVAPSKVYKAVRKYHPLVMLKQRLQKTLMITTMVARLHLLECVNITRLSVGLDADITIGHANTNMSAERSTTNSNVPKAALRSGCF